MNNKLINKQKTLNISQLATVSIDVNALGLSKYKQK